MELVSDIHTILSIYFSGSIICRNPFDTIDEERLGYLSPKSPKQLSVPSFIEIGNNIPSIVNLIIQKIEHNIDNRFFRSHKFITRIKDGQSPRIIEEDLFDRLFWLPIVDFKGYPCAPNVKVFCEEFLLKK